MLFKLLFTFAQFKLYFLGLLSAFLFLILTQKNFCNTLTINFAKKFENKISTANIDNNLYAKKFDKNRPKFDKTDKENLTKLTKKYNKFDIPFLTNYDQKKLKL